MPTYQHINVAEVTPRTAPPYALISFTQRNSQYVLPIDGSDKLLIGPLGVNYYPDGPPTAEGVYLRRWDAPPTRNVIAMRSRLPRD